MDKHIFYHKFANLPLPKRLRELADKFRTGNEKRHVNMNHIYEQVKRIDDLIRPHEIAREKWLELAEDGFEQLKD